MHTCFQSIEQVSIYLHCGNCQLIDDATLLPSDHLEALHRQARLPLQPEEREMLGEPGEQEGTGLAPVRRCS